MGMTVSGTVTYGKPLVASLASMPSVAIAFSEAVIDKAYLTWLDVSKLLIAFPERVKVLSDTVTFQGPVAIISSLSPTQRLYAKCVIGFASGFVCYLACYLFSKAMTPKRKNRLDHAVPIPPKDKKCIKISRIFSFLVAGAGFYLAGRYLPTQAGVYIFRQPPFYV